MKLSDAATAVLALTAELFLTRSAEVEGKTATTSVKNILLMHEARVDASGCKPVYDVLTAHGYHVTIVQEFPAIAQGGPAIPVGHSHGDATANQIKLVLVRTQFDLCEGRGMHGISEKSTASPTKPLR